jgi:hypothetical protein
LLQIFKNFPPGSGILRQSLHNADCYQGLEVMATLPVNDAYPQGENDSSNPDRIEPVSFLQKI